MTSTSKPYLLKIPADRAIQGVIMDPDRDVKAMRTLRSDEESAAWETDMKQRAKKRARKTTLRWHMLGSDRGNFAGSPSDELTQRSLFGQEESVNEKNLYPVDGSGLTHRDRVSTIKSAWSISCPSLSLDRMVLAGPSGALVASSAGCLEAVFTGVGLIQATRSVFTLLTLQS